MSKKIISELTLAEKTRLLTGKGDWHNYDCNGKIGTIMMTDGPHGLRKVENEVVGDVNASKPATCFPTASALASSWDTNVVSLVAGSIAEEAKKEQISVVLGCGINIKRSPLCGRNFEYFSEDPFLAGRMGASYVNAMQARGVGTSLKHFAGNSQETRRMTSNSEIDERALNEIYLQAFETVVREAQPTTIMASYNRLNGNYACANKELLTDTLRNKWGFKGAVISDWGATVDVVSCIKAGLDLEMPDCRGYHTAKLRKALKDGEITEKEIDRAVENVLNLVDYGTSNLSSDSHFDVNEHHSRAVLAETECAVLLKNEGILPISRQKRLIVVGELAKTMRFQGGGSSHINATVNINALEALKASDYDVSFVTGFGNKDISKNKKLHQEAVDFINNNNDDETVILFFMGLTDYYEGEGYDRKDLSIPPCQTELLEEVARSHKNVAAVTFGGAPMDYSWEGNVRAVLHMHLGGQGVGEAVAKLLSGESNPCGKLSETIPFKASDAPSSRHFALNHDDVEYRESIFAGYRYYETFDVPVRYPFGYGLSYTTFEYSNLTLSSDTYKDGTLTVKCKVKNTGSHKGKEIVQLYVLNPKQNFIRSWIELKGFTGVTLEPGEEKEVSLALSSRAFSVYDVSTHDFEVIGGNYVIAVGASVEDLRLKAGVSVEGKEYFRNECELFPEYFASHKNGMEVSKETFEKLYGKPLSTFKERKRGTYDMSSNFKEICSHSLFGNIFRGAINIALKFMYFGKSSKDPDMQMVTHGLWEGSLEGLISNSGGIITGKLASILLLWANRKYGKGIATIFKGKNEV